MSATIGAPREAEYIDAAPEAGGVVYFISDGTAVKIGHTTRSVKDRLSGLQTGNPRPCYVLRTMPGPKELEAAFHAKFAGRRTRDGGEWFTLNPWEVWGLDAPTMRIGGGEARDRVEAETFDSFDAWYGLRIEVGLRWTRVAELHEDFEAWCARAGAPALSRTIFGKRMSSKTDRKTNNGRLYRATIKGGE